MQDGEFANVGGCSVRRLGVEKVPKRALELITEINRRGDKEQRLEEKSRMRRSQQRHRPNPAYKSHLHRGCDLKKKGPSCWRQWTVRSNTAPTIPR